MPTEAMIKPANIEEQVLAKINELKQKKLTAKQKNKLEWLGHRLRCSFEWLTLKYYGIDKSQIRELTDPELNALFNIVYNRSRKISVFIRILCFGIPIDDFDTVLLVESNRKLRKILGSSFDPVKVINQSFNSRPWQKEGS